MNLVACAQDFLLTDQVGTLRAVADTSGMIVKRIDYDSFGNIISDSNPAFSVPFGFAGGLHDRDTGLVRFGYRDYSPELGRFVAKDPIDFAGGDTNLYGYVMNDPVNFTDPLGLFRWDTFGYGVAEILMGAAGVGGGVAATAATSGLAAAAGVMVFYEGIAIASIGLADIVGAFADRDPFVAELPEKLGAMMYILPPDFTKKTRTCP